MMRDLAEIAELLRVADRRGERVRLRPFTPRDIDTEVRMRLDPEYCRYVCDVPTRDEVVAKVATFVEPWAAAEGAWCPLIVTPVDGDEAIGAVAFRIESVDRQTAEFGYRINAGHGGRGLATEAARLLVDFLLDAARLRRLVAYVDAEHQRSIRVLERLGMRREAHFRDHTLLDGRWTDTLVYAVLARERGRSAANS